MADDERLSRLEQRVAVLEDLVRSLRPARPGAAESPTQPIHPREGGNPPPLPSTQGKGAGSSLPWGGAGQERGSPVPLGGVGGRGVPSGRGWGRGGISEQWIGQRGLLAVGVIALILAAGYLLKLSFERGWISPVLRCLGGAAAGFLVGGIGWRLHSRYRTYGAALIGCGAAIIYLAVWAASRLYEFLPPAPGIVGLALVSIALAMIAYAINVEALGATAALGAFFAPLLLGREPARADLLLLYLASMAVGLGQVAGRRRWRLATFVVGAGYFGVLSLAGADRATPWAVLLYAVAGGSAGLWLGFRERWWETRFLSFWGGWALLAAASDRLGSGWPVLAGALLLAAPVWAHALRAGMGWPLRAGAAAGQPASALGEALYFAVTPFMLVWALRRLDVGFFDRAAGLAPLLVGLAYAIAGYLRPRPLFAAVGAAALAVAAYQHWHDVGRVWALLALSVFWPLLDHRQQRTDGRWYGLLTLLLALQQLLDPALTARPPADAAFVGRWALALWSTAAVSLTFAAGLWRASPDEEGSRTVRVGLWALAGALVLFGVSGELRRFFELHSTSDQTADLAAGLAVSAWWLLFAAGLVIIGFRRQLRPARLAGLGVAGLALIKVVVFDLSSLDALYRVGSVFILGLVSLSLAYLYHRQAGRETGP